VAAETGLATVTNNSDLQQANFALVRTVRSWAAPSIKISIDEGVK
jgi:hypothetical protein